MHSFGRTIKVVLLAAVAVVLLSSYASAAEITGSRVQAESVTTPITTNEYYSSAEPKDRKTPNTSRINSNGTVNYPVMIPSGASANAVVVRSRSASTSTGSVNLTVVVDGVDQPAKTITKTERTFATRTWNLSTALGAGSHTIGLKATNTTKANRAISDYFYLDGTSGPPPDTTPPDTSIMSGPAEGSTDIDGDVSFAFSGSDDVGVASFECKMDGAAFAACTSPQAYSALSDGAHTFSVMAKDAAGNVDASPAVRNFSVARPAPISHQARSAHEFVESIGVTTHIAFRNTGYADYQQVSAALDELGVRYIRDRAVRPENIDTWNDYANLCEAYGIKATLNLNFEPWPEAPTSQDFDAMVQAGRSCVVGAFEGPNEPQLQGGEDWLARTEAFHEAAFANLNASQNPQIPLVAAPPAIQAGTYPDPLYDLSQTSEINSMHSYSGPSCPTCSHRAEWESLLLDRDIPMAERVGAPGRPIYATETGWNSFEPHTNYVSEEAQARYTPRQMFEYFNNTPPGSKTYHYQLYDQRTDPSPSSYYGLIANDWQRKPPYYTLENLIDIVDVADVAPGSLAYDIQGAGPSVHSTLLAGPEGEFYLALWQEVSSWDHISDTLLEPEAQQVTLTFDQEKSIQVFDVDSIVATSPEDDAGEHPSRTLVAKSITEPIEDEVKVFRIG